MVLVGKMLSSLPSVSNGALMVALATQPQVTVAKDRETPQNGERTRIRPPPPFFQPILLLG